MRFKPFSRGISIKVNVIERLEFELAYFKAAIQHFNYYDTGTPTEVVVAVEFVAREAMAFLLLIILLLELP